MSYYCSTVPDSAVILRRDPPTPVLVDLRSLYVDKPGLLSEVPWWLIRRGANLDNPIPGLLHAWVRSRYNTWLGLVEVEVPVGRRTLTAQQLVPAQYITRA